MSTFRENHLVGESGHATLHNDLARALNYRVYAHRFATLQAAVNAAITSKRPLELEPGVIYSLSEPLVVSDVRRFRLSGNGAIIRATADMDMLLDLNGIADCKIEGLDLTTDSRVTVQDMVRYRWQEGVSRSSTRNGFAGIHISGNYVNGWHVGDGERQVDISEWHRCNCTGQWQTGEETLWQTGWLLGDGIHGNGMLTSFYSCGSYFHRNHWKIDGYRYVYVGPGCNGSISEVDIVSNATRAVEAHGYRSEGGAMLFKADAGGATYPMLMKLSGCGFHPGDGLGGITMPEGGAVIDCNYGGTLIVENMACQPLEALAVLVRSRNLQRPLHVDVAGAVLEGVAPEAAFDLDELTTLRSFGIQQINAQGAIVDV